MIRALALMTLIAVLTVALAGGSLVAYGVIASLIVQSCRGRAA